MARYLYQLLVLIFITTTLTNSQTPKLAFARVADIDTCEGVLVVESTRGFSDGDMILVHQAFGAEIDNNGNVRSLQSAGQFEFAVVDRCIGTQLYLRTPLAHHFQCTEGVQACRVITQQHVRITSELRAPPFVDGRGGIIAIVADTITLDALLDAHGCGYRGGERSISGWDTCIADGNAFLFDGTSGAKGGSVARCISNQQAGRNRFGNGGGGGNARNAGGGGGAGGNNGGNGGYQTSEYKPLANGGQGAHSISDTISTLRLIFGGGGGGGHQNDFGGSSGGSGGGLIYLRGSVLVCLSGSLLEVGGEDALPSFDDGAGGGGGGGMVVISADTIAGVLKINARGGNGGDAYSTYPCMGTGGGGAGGSVVANSELRIASSKQQIANSFDLDLGGGCAGRTFAFDTTCSRDSTYGATSGDSGTIRVLKFDEEEKPKLCADPDVVVSVADTHAPAGVIVEIPLEIDVQKTLTRDVDVRLRIRTRASVLMPNGPYWWAGRRAMVRYVSVTLQAGPPRVEVVELKYFTALGDSAVVGVTIDSIQHTPASVRVVRGRNGVFTLDGVCDATGEARLFDPFESRQETEFEFYDVLGRRTDERIIWKHQARPQR